MTLQNVMIKLDYVWEKRKREAPKRNSDETGNHYANLHLSLFLPNAAVFDHEICKVIDHLSILTFFW